MGNIRQPNWSVRAPGVKGLAGAVLTLTDHGGSPRVATIGSYSHWETSWQSWRERDKNKPQQAEQAGPMTPAQILRRNPNSLLPSPQVQVQLNAMQALQLLPNILPPQVQPPPPPLPRTGSAHTTEPQLPTGPGVAEPPLPVFRITHDGLGH